MLKILWSTFVSSLSSQDIFAWEFWSYWSICWRFDGLRGLFFNSLRFKKIPQAIKAELSLQSKLALVSNGPSSLQSNPVEMKNVQILKLQHIRLVTLLVADLPCNCVFIRKHSHDFPRWLRSSKPSPVQLIGYQQTQPPPPLPPPFTILHLLYYNHHWCVLWNYQFFKSYNVVG